MHYKYQSVWQLWTFQLSFLFDNCKTISVVRSSTDMSVLYRSFRPSACQANVRPSSKVSSVSPVWRLLRQSSHNIYASLFLGHKELFHNASFSKMRTHSCASHYIQHAQIHFIFTIFFWDSVQFYKQSTQRVLKNIKNKESAMIKLLFNLVNRNSILPNLFVEEIHKLTIRQTNILQADLSIFIALICTLNTVNNTLDYLQQRRRRTIRTRQTSCQLGPAPTIRILR